MTILIEVTQALWLLMLLISTYEYWSLRGSITRVWNISIQEWLSLIFMRALLGVSFVLVGNPWLGLGLLINQLYLNHKFYGSFNGGSCFMHLTILIGLIFSTFTLEWGLLWIGVQSVLSYWLAGLSKVTQKEWWSSKALITFLSFSPYRNHHSAIWLSKQPTLVTLISLTTLAFECFAPLALLLPHGYLIAFLCGLMIFHLNIAWFFGLNRFWMSWAASWPGFYFLAGYIQNLIQTHW